MLNLLSPLTLKKAALATLLLSLCSAYASSSPQYNYRVPARGLGQSGASAAGGSSCVAGAGAVSFSTCGATGRFGPTLAQCQAAYAAQPLLACLAMSSHQGYQEWTVPVSGAYTITAAGAGGGQAPGYNQGAGGRGAILRGTFVLTQGTVLEIVVGQSGIDGAVSPNGATDAGGGGASFVVTKSGNTPLLVAGGGGGGSYYSSGSPFIFYGVGGDGGMSATPANPPAGHPYTYTRNYGEPGGSFATDGAFPGWGTTNFSVAGGFVSDAVGGISTNAPVNRYGGFGGGAGAHGASCIGGGGGGGYVGGIGAQMCASGGGGSSYINGAAASPASSDGTFEGTALGSTALGWTPQSTAGYVTITPVGP